MALRLLDYKIAPALRVFPTLKRFTPALQPRWLIGIPPGGPLPGAISHGSISSVYDDLGVIAFAGASVKQATRIGTLLEKVVSLGGASVMRTATYHPSDRYHKIVKYRLPVEDGHIDPIFKTEEGYLSIEGLLRLGKTAAFKWGTGALESSNDPDINTKTVKFREHNVRIQQGPLTQGVVHQTINGPRRLPVDAILHIAIKPGVCRVSMSILFYTAIKGHYLGTTKLHLDFYSAANGMQPLHADYTSTIFEGGPHEVPARRSDRDFLNKSVWNLERQVWAHREPRSQSLDQRQTPKGEAANHVQNSRRGSGGLDDES
ncbi:hypothetical protein BGZ61DRAFT_455197 [Ilyonectria robusta]|uniref:uncharacterized protein n=1 Tax=Ilyonectria robusta TaxID=1079257 RepID=UPI001E8CA9BF|nr:uncharacterized protein BGZ61DRAFT_455197 [Ilyonectria robusta]KAH8685263.1 hypothetical protein BGZ61DRAFT_455197 [Ilyonectria robusta]